MNSNAQHITWNKAITIDNLFRVICWALVFILRQIFPPGSSVATTKLIIFILSIIQVSRHQFLQNRNGRNGHFLGWDKMQSMFGVIYSLFSHKMPPFISFGNKDSL